MWQNERTQRWKDLRQLTYRSYGEQRQCHSSVQNLYLYSFYDMLWGKVVRVRSSYRCGGAYNGGRSDFEHVPPLGDGRWHCARRVPLRRQPGASSFASVSLTPSIVSHAFDLPFFFFFFFGPPASQQVGALHQPPPPSSSLSRALPSTTTPYATSTRTIPHLSRSLSLPSPPCSFFAITREDALVQTRTAAR